MIRKILSLAVVGISINISAQDIHRTVCQGNISRLDSLLIDSSIEAVDNRGRSLLHWAIGCDQKEVFQYLQERGAEINSEDYQKRIPLHIAVNRSNLDYFNLLVDAQTDDIWKAKYGPSLLEQAVMSKDSSMIQHLINKGVDINWTNNRGSSPLEIAERIGADNIAQFLKYLGADEEAVRTFTIKGQYMGEKVPGIKSKMFAPNFISTEESEFGSVFNSDGTEFYFGFNTNGKSEIRYSKMVEGQWSVPITILSHERYGYNDPFLSPDEQRLYFISGRALDGIGDKKDIDIWYVNKTASGWSEPINAGPNINTDGNEYYISFTQNGTMYFSSNKDATEDQRDTDFNIYYSNFIDGEFQVPVMLGDAINTNSYEADVFVAPDESYIIYCSSRDNGYGQGDLYISFKNADDSWTQAVNMGEAINTKLYEYCPYVSADGKYLFYTSNQDIYWISTDIFDQLKNQK